MPFRYLKECLTKQRGLFISGNFQCNEIDERGTDANPPPARKDPVYLTQDDMQNILKTIKHVMFVLSFVLVLLGWMVNYFVGKYDASDIRSQETSKAMAVAQTQIAQLSTENSTLKSEISELKKVEASQHERILKLEFQNQQSPKNK